VFELALILLSFGIMLMWALKEQVLRRTSPPTETQSLWDLWPHPRKNPFEERLTQNKEYVTFYEL